MPDHDRWTLLDAHLTIQCPNRHLVTLRRWDTVWLARGYVECDKCPRQAGDLPKRWLLSEELRVCPPKEGEASANL